MSFFSFGFFSLHSRLLYLSRLLFNIRIAGILISMLVFFLFFIPIFFFLFCEIFLFPFVVQFTPAINSFRINKCLILKRTNQFILLIVRLSRLFPPSPLDRFHLISFSLIPSKDLPVFYSIWPLNEKTHKRHSQKFSSKNKTHFHSMVSKFNELLLYETLNSRWHSMRYN